MPESILIVDDDDGLSLLMQRALQGEGLDAERAASGTEALEWLQSNHADMILLDQNLPDITGKDMIKKLAANGRAIPFLVITGHGDELLAAEMMKAGARDYIVKETGLMELLPAVVRKTLARIEQEKKLSQAEEALRKSEEQFRLAFENARDAILWIDPDTQRIINCNKAAESLIERGRDRIIGSHQSELYPPDMVEEFGRIFTELRPGGEVDIEAKFATASGDNTPVLISAGLTTIRSKPVIQAIIHDISQIKRAQLALRMSEQCFRAIADYTYYWEVWVSPKGRLLWTNPAVRRVTGYSVKELLAMSDYPMPLIHPSDRQRMARAFNSALRGGSGKELEFRLRRKDGTIIWAEISWQPIYDENGSSQGHRASIRDITDRKQAQEKTREIQDRFQLLARATNDAIWDWDLASNNFWHNEAYETLFGFAADEIGPSTDWWKDHIHPSDRNRVVSGIQYTIQDEQQTWSDEYRFRRKDGSYAYILDRGFIIHDDNGKAIRMIGSMMDITDRKQVEQELVRYQRQLRSLASELSLSEERLRRQIAIEIHDNISQNLAISKIKLEALVKSARSGAKAGQLGQVRELIAQTIENARSVTLELSPPVLYELGFEPAIRWLTDQAGKRHGFGARYESDQADKPLEHNVRVLLFQATRELLVNVAKHARASKVVVSSRRLNGQIQLCVSDNGVGFEAEAVLGDNKSAAGFGLFSIRERLGHINGELLVKSNPGEGTTVCLTAPIAVGGQDAEKNTDEH